MVESMNRIRELRSAAGLSQESLARLVGTTHSHISRIERGLVGLTDVWMTRIAAQLGVDPAELLGGTVSHPGYRELAKDENERALLLFWRTLDEAQRAILLRMIKPPTD